MFGLDTAETVDVAVGLSTLVLAGVTVWLGAQTRTQAKASVKMAEIAERQLEATTTPVVRLMRLDQPDQVDICTVNRGGPGERLVARIENRGPPAVELEKVTLRPGGTGVLADTGRPASPTLEPGMEWDVDFELDDDAKGDHERGLVARLTMAYMAVETGARYASTAWVQCVGDAPDERWKLVKERHPRLLGAD